MGFDLFDRKGELRIQQGNLPHWFQPGVTYFVTFRTEDSVPQNLSRQWHARRVAWLRRNGIDASRAGWKEGLRRSPQLEREYYALFTRRFMEYSIADMAPAC